MKLNFVRDAFLWAQIFLTAIIVGATVFQMFVIIPEFTRDFPNGMIALSQSNVIPGNFWGSPFIFLPMMLLPLLNVVFNWKTPRRKWLLIVFCLGIAGSVYTSNYFVPRLRIMGLLDSPITSDLTVLKAAVSEWILHDKFRFWLIGVPGFACLLKAASIKPSKIISSQVDNSSYKTAVAV